MNVPYDPIILDSVEQGEMKAKRFSNSGPSNLKFQTYISSDKKMCGVRESSIQCIMFIRIHSKFTLESYGEMITREFTEELVFPEGGEIKKLQDVLGRVCE
jgi:hypothetical protein